MRPWGAIVKTTHGAEHNTPNGSGARVVAAARRIFIIIKRGFFMGDFTATKVNAISAAVCAASAAETGNKILTITTTLISAATLIVNFFLDCYRKYRDRDKDIKKDDDKCEKK